MSQKTSAGRYQIDMTQGAILPKLIRFALPMMLSNILQLTFAAADSITVGRFAGEDSLAAVGATVSLISLITNCFLGISVGANVAAARYFGAKDDENLSKTVHTTFSLALITGVLLNVIGFFLAPELLVLMKTPDSILPLSTLYLRIYFFCMVPLCIFNFCSALLRAVGDTKRPLFYMTFAGILNIGLNLFTVIVLHMGVAGVAIGTFVSQTICAVLTIRCMMREEGGIRFLPKKIAIDRNVCMQILRVGIPAGLQSTMYSISNVVIQSAINIFGEATIAANTAAVNLEDMIYFALNALMQSVTSFVGQNMGQRRYDRIRRVMLLGLACVMVSAAVMCSVELIFAEQLMGIFSKSNEVIRIGVDRLHIVVTLYFLCGVQEMFIGGMRGMGTSMLPTILSLICIVGIRLSWLTFVFPHFMRPEMIYILYPMTWIIASTAEGIAFFCVFRRISRPADRKA